MTTAVLIPFSRSRAIELGNRLWRKRLLPAGDVQYKDRMLHFTRNYLAGLADAFRTRIPRRSAHRCSRRAGSSSWPRTRSR